MKTIKLTLILVCASFISYAQVGIGNTDPKATLDISASDIFAPANTDGILIPRIDNFPSTNPTFDQHGMLVFITGSGVPNRGFYYWDNSTTSWTALTTLDTKNTLDEAYDEGGPGFGRSITADSGPVQVNGNDGFLVLGVSGFGNPIDVYETNNGSKMFYNHYKSAFRAGEVTSNQWNDVNIGEHSVALGNNTIASGIASTSIGRLNQASGFSTVALGFANNAYGYAAVSLGNNNNASADHTVAIGNSNSASGDSSVAIGRSSVAEGNSSFSLGVFTTAESYGETVLGLNDSDYIPASTNSFNNLDRLFSIGNGSSTATRSNALTIYKSGLMNINDAYNMPLTDGSTNQVMTTDGSGNITFQDVVGDGTGTDDQTIDQFVLTGTTLRLSLENDGQPDQVVNLSSLPDSNTQNTLDQAYDEGGIGVGRVINATNGAVRVNGTDGLLITGVFNAGQNLDSEITGAGTRMFFYPRKSAFRAGTVTSTQWSFTNTGNYSTAFGFGTRASGETSTAFGYTTDAIGLRSTAFGSNTSASGNLSTSFGGGTTASDYVATAFGNQTTASGYISTAFGDDTTASGRVSTTFGANTIAAGYYASAFGQSNTAASYVETVLGNYATNYTPNSAIAFNSTDRLFTIGNGTSNTLRSNALTIYKSGLMNINDEYNMPLTDGTNGQVMTTNGAGVVSFQDATVNTDDQNIIGSGLSGTNLTIGIENGSSQIIDLSSLQDGTGSDDQDLQTPTLTGTILNLNIENGLGASIDLAPLQDGTGSDDQNITGSGLSGTDLTIGIENGSSQIIDLSSLQDGTGSDDQNITGSGLSGTDLTIGIESGSSQIIDLSSLQDGDTQNTLDEAYDEGGAGAGRSISADNGAVEITGEDGFQVTGTFDSGDAITLSGAGTRMFFNPNKAAFRVGGVSGNEWNDVNVGQYSVAFGTGTTASVLGSTAFGSGSTASGSVATAFGNSTTASNGSTTAFGLNTTASGYISTAFGDDTNASGRASTTFGANTTAAGHYANASGIETSAPSYAETSIGAYSTNYTPTSSTISENTDRLFSIGNGTSSSRSNALTIYKSGLMNINDEYDMPLTDGTNGQVMTTDGAGNVTFQNIVGDGTGNDWSLTGNAGTDSSIEFIGTTDNEALSFRTNNTEKIRLTEKGQIETYNTGNSVFIGELAGELDDLSDNNNVFIGRLSGQINTSGTSNTFVGFNSGRNNSTGSGNVAIGSNSLSNNSSSLNNIAIGNQSNLDGTGSSNITMGFDSGHNLGSGDNNIIIGDQAGNRDNLTSSQNVYIGAFAGGGTVNNGSTPYYQKNGNVFIGHHAGRYQTASNRLFIENSDSNEPLIYGEFDNNILRANGEFQINDPSTTGYAFPATDGTNGQVMTTDGSGVISFQDAAINTDNQNIESLSLNASNVLTVGIENGSSDTVDLSSLQDGTGTDNQNIQNLSLNASNVLTVGIENGTSQTVNLSSLQDGTGSDDQNLTLTGTNLSIEDGNTVNLNTINTDNQEIDNFSFNTTTNVLTLEIEDDGQAAQTVDLSSLNPQKALARITMSAAQTTTGAGTTKVNFDTEDFDIGNNFNLATDNFVVPEDGVYRVTAQLTMSASTGTGAFAVRIRVNGIQERRADFNHHGNGQVIRQVTSIINLTAGQILDVSFSRPSVGATIEPNVRGTFFEIEQL